MTFIHSDWRKLAAPIISKVIEENRDKDEKQIRLALRAAYPFGQRKYHPYKIWLDEIARQLGKKWPIGHKLAWQNGQKRKTADYKRLQEWESIYGRRA